MILETLRFVVIVGTLSSAIANQDFTNLRGRVSPYHNLLEYLNTTVAEVEKFDEDLCTKNGGPGAYDIQKASWEQCERCIQNVLFGSQTQLSDGFTSSEPPSINTPLREFCNRVPRIENCIKNLTTTIKMCLDPEKHESTNVIYNSISAVLRFLCKGDSMHVMEFGFAGGEECIKSKKLALGNCANHTILKYIQETIPNGAAVGGLGALHLLVPDMNKCTIYENYQHCAVDSLKSCPHGVLPANFVNSLFNVIKKATTCEHLLKSQAPPIGVVNVLLMTAVTTISLRFAPIWT